MTEKDFHGPLVPGRAITQRMVDLLKSQGVELPPPRAIDDEARLTADKPQEAAPATVDDDQPYSEMFD